ncbi:MAG: hypothetical protein ACRDTZ_03835 [Pseudonocardiaceae bacterium]
MAIGTESVIVAVCDNDSCGKRHVVKDGEPLPGVTGTAVRTYKDGEQDKVEWFACLTNAPGHIGKAIRDAFERSGQPDAEPMGDDTDGDDGGWSDRLA